MDQSTESRSTCRRTLQNYASALKQESFASLFPDKLPVVVVYVTKSDDRAKGLTQLIESMGSLSYRAVALPMQSAAEWLFEAVTQPPGAMPGSAGVTRAVDYDDLFKTLSDIYETFCEDLRARQDRGEQLVPLPSVLRAYEVLNKVRAAS